MNRWTATAVALLAAACALGPQWAEAQQPDWPRIASPGEQFGLYGWVHQATLEPGTGEAERIRLCGSFASGTPGSHVQRGCLYFSRLRGSTAVLAEWQALKRLADTGSPMTNQVGGVIRGLVGFGRPGLRALVRTAADDAVPTDVYAGGEPVALVPYAQAPAVLGRTPKPAHTVNYAIVDRVLIDTSNRIRIDGLFSMQADGARVSFERPQRGYVYLSGGRAIADAQAWTAVAGSGRVVRFYLFGGSDDRVRVRPETDPPGTPDQLVTWGGPEPTAIEGDSDYFPVRVLREQRR